MSTSILSIPAKAVVPRVRDAIKYGAIQAIFGLKHVPAEYFAHLERNDASVDRTIFHGAHDAARIVVFGKR